MDAHRSRRESGLVLAMTGTALLSFGVVAFCEFLLDGGLCSMACVSVWPNLIGALVFLCGGTASLLAGAFLSPRIFIGPEGVVESSVLCLFLGAALVEIDFSAFASGVLAPGGFLSGMFWGYGDYRPVLFFLLLAIAAGYLLSIGIRRWWTVASGTT